MTAYKGALVPEPPFTFCGLGLYTYYRPMAGEQLPDRVEGPRLTLRRWTTQNLA